MNKDNNEKEIVSYNIAKLLAEQFQFNEGCYYNYFKYSENCINKQHTPLYKNNFCYNGEKIDDGSYAAPTIVQALDFLNKIYRFRKIIYKQEDDGSWSFKVINPEAFDKLLTSKDGLNTKTDVLESYINWLCDNTYDREAYLEDFCKGIDLKSDYRDICTIKEKGLSNVYFWPKRLEKHLAKAISDTYDEIINEIKELNPEWKPNYE